MVTSLPRVHVAVMGVEKVVPSLTDLMVFLAILAKSATGQKLSVYTTLVQGPRRAGEPEGPHAFHPVLPANGRVAHVAGPPPAPPSIASRPPSAGCSSGRSSGTARSGASPSSATGRGRATSPWWRGGPSVSAGET